MIENSIADIYPNAPGEPRCTMYQAEVGGMVAIDALVSPQTAADFLRMLAASGGSIDITDRVKV